MTMSTYSTCNFHVILTDIYFILLLNMNINEALKTMIKSMLDF